MCTTSLMPTTNRMVGSSMVSTVIGCPIRVMRPTCQSTVSATTPMGTSTPQAARKVMARKIASSSTEAVKKSTSSRSIFWM